MIKRTIIFLIINFSALGIGSYLMGEGPSSEWYKTLNKAPWTPPGWVFGFAWTTIMICFSVFISYAYQAVVNKNTLLVLFVLQVLLNISWNPVFFNYHYSLLGLAIISLLTIVTIILMTYSYHAIKVKTLLILPYVLWLLIATSLNGYIYFNNK
jgi:benzodiazapine receptor